MMHKASPVWLILYEKHDSAALWLYEGLKARGLEPLELLPAQKFSLSTVWEHRVQSDRVLTEITFPDGQRIQSDALKGVVNRLQHTPTYAMALIDPSDHEYVYHELTTFFMSWLHGLPPPVLNRPKPRSLSGSSPHISEWIWMAGHVGLPTPGYVYSEYEHVGSEIAYGSLIKTVFVVGDRVVGPVPSPEMRRSCLQLAVLSEIELLGIDFAVAPNGAWTFLGASSHPDLRTGGAVLLDATAEYLRGRWSDRR